MTNNSLLGRLLDIHGLRLSFDNNDIAYTSLCEVAGYMEAHLLTILSFSWPTNLPTVMLCDDTALVLLHL